MGSSYVGTKINKSICGFAIMSFKFSIKCSGKVNWSHKGKINYKKQNYNSVTKTTVN